MYKRIKGSGHGSKLCVILISLKVMVNTFRIWVVFVV